jgi:UDP-N-acetylglucosamine 2-epimerase (non-hydrolysing)
MGKICLIVGTRPEIIKVAPVVLEFRRRGFNDFILVSTGQHKDLLDPYWSLFDLKADYELSFMQPGSTLGQLTARAFQQLEDFFTELGNAGGIDIMLAQGDTTTVMVSSVLAFYKKIPFAHLEAGLRSYDLENPFPEEFNRKVATVTSRLHLAPTSSSKINLVKEGILPDDIFIVGNTVVDALNYVRELPMFKSDVFRNSSLQKKFLQYKQHVLVTCHRRENHGDNLLELISAITRLAAIEKDVLFVWPVHPNPNVKTVVNGSDLNGLPNVLLTEPLDYMDILKVLSRCKKVISDSGGIQEEAPSFKVPVLVLRTATERNEAIKAGLSKLVNFTAPDIVDDYLNFSPKFNDGFENPFGDGFAARKVVDILLDFRKKKGG